MPTLKMLKLKNQKVCSIKQVAQLTRPSRDTFATVSYCQVILSSSNFAELQKSRRTENKSRSPDRLLESLFPSHTLNIKLQQTPRSLVRQSSCWNIRAGCCRTSVSDCLQPVLVFWEPRIFTADLTQERPDKIKSNQITHRCHLGAQINMTVKWGAGRVRGKHTECTCRS